MNVSVRWTDGMQFVGLSGSGHAVVMDASEANGGFGSAAGPMEMVLMGLAGCSGIDVIHILKKKRVEFDGLVIDIEAERKDTHPKVFNHVKAIFRFRGANLQEKALETAVQLSMEKYCSVAGMVSQTAQIDWQIDIEPDSKQ